MTITVDINVLLDVFQQRQPHYAASASVVDLVVSGHVVGVCPAHGLTTLYYLVRKHTSKPGAEAALDRVLRPFQIGNLDGADFDPGIVVEYEPTRVTAGQLDFEITFQ